MENASRIEAYGSVAHEIGHHLNKHSLSDQILEIEERDADFFMGFILYKANFSEGEIRDFLKKMPKKGGSSFDEKRFNTVLEGFKKSESVVVFKGLSDPV